MSELRCHTNSRQKLRRLPLQGSCKTSPKTCTPKSEILLKQATTEFTLSARAHDKICKLARTIADLATAEDIAPRTYRRGRKV